jgi:hypothetical protein
MILYFLLVRNSNVFVEFVLMKVNAHVVHSAFCLNITEHLPSEREKGVRSLSLQSNAIVQEEQPKKRRKRRTAVVPHGAPAPDAGTLMIDRDCHIVLTGADISAASEVLQSTTKTRQRRTTKADITAPSKQPRNMLATEILNNLTKFPHCILLTRVGQFYEVLCACNLL